MSVGSHWVTIDCKEIKSDLQQKEIGFVYSNASVFNLEVLPTVIITFIKSGTGLIDPHTVSPTTLLGADLVAGQKIVYSAIPTTGFQWDKVKISFNKLVGLNFGQSSLHHAFVRDIQLPEQSNQCDLGFFADELICGDAPSYTFPNDIALTWSLESIVAQDGKTDITGDYTIADIIKFSSNGSAGVTFLTGAPQGIYTFRGTDNHGCTGTIKVYRGKTVEMQQATGAQTSSFTFLNSLRDKVHLSVADEGSLISIDNLKNSANVIDGNLNTCATYAKGLQLLANTGIVSVKKDAGTFDAGTAVGNIPCRTE